MFFSGLSLKAQLFQKEGLIELRKECDSLECPDKYAQAYRLLSENLKLPLEDRFFYLDIAEKISLELADKADLLAIHAQRGRLNLDKRRYVESLKAFGEGSKHLGYRKDEQWLEQEGWFLTGYGILLYRVRLYYDALEVFRDCAKVMHSIDDHYGEAVAWNNVALCYFNLGVLDSAEHYFLKAYKVREEIGDQFLLCHSLLYLSRLYRAKGDLAGADSAMAVADRLNRESDRNEFLGDIFCEWAQIALGEDDLASAAYYLEEAKGMDFPYLDLVWLDLKIQLFERLGLKDSLMYYLDTALFTARDFGNLDLELELLSKKRVLLAEENKVALEKEVMARSLAVSRDLIAIKDSVQQDMLRVQREVSENNTRLKKLEISNQQQEETIRTKNSQILFISLIAVLLLAAFTLYYYFYNRVRKLSRDVRLLDERSRLAAEQMKAGVLVIDRGGRLLFQNNAARQHFAFFNGEGLREGSEFLSQLKDAALKKDWSLRLREVKNIGNYQNISNRDRELRSYFHMVSLSTIISEGRSEGIVAVINDVTVSQEKSAALSRKTQALEQANAAKEKVLSLLAHDLKEGVVGSYELAKLSLEGSDDQERVLHLKMIQDSLGKTKSLLFKTLDWVKHQGNGIQLQRKNFYIHRLVNDVIKEQQLKIEAKQISCLNNCPEELEVTADPNALRIVIRNLLANAIKFVPVHAGQISFRCERIPGHKVEFFIEDNGQGMGPKQVSDLMDDEKLMSTPGTQGEIGTGMGLSLCRDLLFQMGSTLQVESSLGEGSIFYFPLDSPQGSQEQ